MSVNKVILIGNLGNDPEVRFTTAGKQVTNFRIATNERWLDADNKRQERTEWHRIVAWGAIAKACGEYLAKGRQVYIEGTLKTRAWTPDDGKQRFTTEVHASNVSFLGGRKEESNQVQNGQSNVVPEATIDDPQRTQEAQQTFGDDGLPF